MPKTRTELTAKLDAVEARVLSGDEKGVARQHTEGKLTARERILALLDPDSFVEEFALAETHVSDFGMAERRRPGDGVIAGYGTVEGRLVFVYAQDYTVLAGTVGAAHGEKIAYVTEVAQKVGAPVVGLLDSAGARIQEGLDVTRAIGRIFYANTLASGAVPPRPTRRASQARARSVSLRASATRRTPTSSGTRRIARSRSHGHTGVGKALAWMSCCQTASVAVASAGSKSGTRRPEAHSLLAAWKRSSTFPSRACHCAEGTNEVSQRIAASTASSRQSWPWRCAIHRTSRPKSPVTARPGRRFRPPPLRPHRQ